MFGTDLKNTVNYTLYLYFDTLHICILKNKQDRALMQDNY